MEFSFRDSTARISKPTERRGLGLNQRGQGVTEYILLLVVILAIAAGGIYQLNTAFQAWAENYFGNYVACLLETGELPSLGGTPGDSGICNEEFQAFSWDKGRPYKLPPSSGATTAANTKPAGSTSDSGEGGSGRPVYQRSGGRFGGGQWGRGGSEAKMVKLNRSSASEESEGSTGSTEISSTGRAFTSRSTSRRVNQGRILDNSFASEREQREASKRQKIGGNSKSAQENLRKTRVAFKPPKPKAQVLSEEQPFSFGNLFRLLLIAIIVIALVVVIGGQLYSASKNSD